MSAPAMDRFVADGCASPKSRGRRPSSPDLPVSRQRSERVVSLEAEEIFGAKHSIKSKRTKRALWSRSCGSLLIDRMMSSLQCGPLVVVKESMWVCIKIGRPGVGRPTHPSKRKTIEKQKGGGSPHLNTHLCDSRGICV